MHGKNVDYRHNVRGCPVLKHMFQPLVNNVAEWYEEEEQSHPFDMAFSSEFETHFPFNDKDGEMFGESQ